LGEKIKTSTGPHGTTAAPTAVVQPITTQLEIKVAMQVIVSFVILAVGLLILTSPHRIFPHDFDEGTKRWAAGWIGAVIGYWFS